MTGLILRDRFTRYPLYLTDLLPFNGSPSCTAKALGFPLHVLFSNKLVYFIPAGVKEKKDQKKDLNTQSLFCGDKAELHRNCNHRFFGSFLPLIVMDMVMILATISLLDHHCEKSFFCKPMACVFNPAYR